MKKQRSSGVVYLVGAGPGDPGLITVRGRQLLEQANVVVYDHLANPQLLDYCPQAKVLYAGKRAARHALTQDQINQLLVKHGKLGSRVVRLKGGDPFIFGRGGEECQALHKAGVRFETVPGITASIGGSAYAGIPLTHRDLNSSITLVTGHEKEEIYKDPLSRRRESATGSSDIDWATIAKLPCIAFYMGVKSLPRISQKLIEHGMSEKMPAATIQWATTARQRTVVSTIRDLPKRIVEAGITAPAMTVVGKVVSLRPILNWFENRPLFGRTIAVTRTRQQVSELAMKLQELGANVIAAPTIQIVPPRSWTAIDRAITQIGGFDWVIFTSANGVEAARQRLDALKLDGRVFGKAKIAAIGDATAAAIRQHLCLKVDLCPDSFVAEALADELAKRAQVKGRRFLLLRADIARPVLREKLQKGGAAQVLDLPIYQTQTVKSLPQALIDALDAGRLDWVTFTSSSTVTNFIQLVGRDYPRKLKNVKLASIGPITTQTMRKNRLNPTIQAATFNVDGMVKAILEAVKKDGNGSV
ncbi:MAG TPA: uroporphyrinogen-III C-methyltransferase [Tepidisphaeraceae bacterium]|nr:uroporphyrinogen-III C-methyltransferase [Tepidisphaeraceae bacterium]